MPINLILNLKDSPAFLCTGIDIAYILYANGIIDYNNNNIRNSNNKNTYSLNRLNFSFYSELVLNGKPFQNTWRFGWIRELA